MEQINSIKQPAPSIVTAANKSSEIQKNEVLQPKRKINAPNVGVVDVPNITKTPISDMLTIKKQENPRMAYKVAEKKNGLFKFYNIATIGISAASLYCILELIMKIKKSLKP